MDKNTAVCLKSDDIFDWKNLKSKKKRKQYDSISLKLSQHVGDEEFRLHPQLCAQLLLLRHL